jgi:hypothetical protein
MHGLQPCRCSKDPRPPGPAPAPGGRGPLDPRPPPPRPPVIAQAPMFDMGFFQGFVRPSLHDAYTGWGLDFSW